MTHEKEDPGAGCLAALITLGLIFTVYAVPIIGLALIMLMLAKYLLL